MVKTRKITKFITAMGTNSVAICNVFIGLILLQDSVLYFAIIIA